MRQEGGQRSFLKIEILFLCVNRTENRKKMQVFKIAFPFLTWRWYKMIREEMKINFSAEKADENFDNLKKSIQGLYEILKITMDKDDLYFKMGLDNIMGIYQNFLELMLNDYGDRQFMRRLRNSEIDIDIPLDFLEQKKGNIKREN